jgi:hypothetical protein
MTCVASVLIKRNRWSSVFGLAAVVSDDTGGFTIIY